MKNVIENSNKTCPDTSLKDTGNNNKIASEDVPVKKKKSNTIRAALICLLIFTVICGVIYPVSVTLISQTLFPYEANGSQIEVTLADGTTRVFGSELIGQNYESAIYMFGRVNTGAPTNLSPESDEYLQLLEERIAERKEKLALIGYNETEIPAELITSSGSGVDPHISTETAYYQVQIIVQARNLYAQSEEEKITNADVESIIEKYTEGRFLWIFGEETVNVLLVNLALDGLI